METIGNSSSYEAPALSTRISIDSFSFLISKKLFSIQLYQSGLHGSILSKPDCY